jgi:RHS repeat-associated protein
MVVTEKYTYDAAGRTHTDSTLGAIATLTGTSADYVTTTYGYDAAGNQNEVTNPDGSYSLTFYDAMGQTTETQSYGTDGLLFAQTDCAYHYYNGNYTVGGVTYPDVGEVTTTTVDKIEKVNNVMEVTGSLTTTDYYDGLGRMAEETAPDGTFTKYQYDADSRLEGTYVGSNDVGGPTSVTGDTITSQSILSYDCGYRVWLTVSYARNAGDTTDTGVLTSDDARVTYDVQWFDNLGRVSKDVNFGTTPPISGSPPCTDTGDYHFGGYTYMSPHLQFGTTGANAYILTQYGYDGFGRNYLTTDNAGLETGTFYDSAGREKYVVQNYNSGFDPTSESTAIETLGGGANQDQNSVTEYDYNDAGLLSDQIAWDVTPATVWAPPIGNVLYGRTPEDTHYVYAMDLTNSPGSPVADGSLLRATIYSASPNVGNFGQALQTVYFKSPMVSISGVISDLNTATSGNFVETTYNANGSVATKTDQNGTAHTYSYDNMGRLYLDSATATNSAVDTGVRAISYAYNPAGQVSAITSWSIPNPVVTSDSPISTDTTDVVNQVAYDYDGWGNVTQTWQSDSGALTWDSTTQLPTAVAANPSVQYSYDDLDRLQSVTYPTTSRVVYYNYANVTMGDTTHATDGTRGMLIGISNSSDSTQPAFVAYSYLGDGTIVQEDHPQVTDGTNHGLTLTYGTAANGYNGLDQFGRVLDQKWTGPDGGALDKYVYTYDAAGNVATKANSTGTGLDEKYTYDGLNRLIGTQRGTLVGGNITNQTYAQGWILDQEGNWVDVSATTNGTTTDQTRTTDASNEIQTVNGQDTTSYDQTGNMTFDGTFHYTYDAWNRQTAVYNDTVNGSGQHVDGTLVATYEYDGRGYRVSKTVGSGAGAVRTDYYYNNNWQVLEERQGAYGSQTMTAQYVWDAKYIDSPVCRMTPQTGGGTLTLYYTTDANNSVTALVDGSTGAVVEQYDYSAYGNVTVYDGTWTAVTGNQSQYGNEILYCGYRQDPETAVYSGSTMTTTNYQVRHREYNTSYQWLQRDPIGYRGGGTDLYAYADSSPACFTDYSGLAAWGWNDVTINLSGASPVTVEGRIIVTKDKDGMGFDWKVQLRRTEESRKAWNAATSVGQDATPAFHTDKWKYANWLLLMDATQPGSFAGISQRSARDRAVVYYVEHDLSGGVSSRGMDPDMRTMRKLETRWYGMNGEWAPNGEPVKYSDTPTKWKNQEINAIESESFGDRFAAADKCHGADGGTIDIYVFYADLEYFSVQAWARFKLTWRHSGNGFCYSVEQIHNTTKEPNNLQLPSGVADAVQSDG